jgi:hypothetical protein
MKHASFFLGEVLSFEVLQVNLVMLLVWLQRISNYAMMLVPMTFVQKNTVGVCI